MLSRGRMESSPDVNAKVFLSATMTNALSSPALKLGQRVSRNSSLDHVHAVLSLFTSRVAYGLHCTPSAAVFTIKMEGLTLILALPFVSTWHGRRERYLRLLSRSSQKSDLYRW
jgi:hypothetical protein